ncbi:MAG: RluA family pseudouridine synthase [Firmicutes bacterium]|nr:RluA family pseudouridine synthase [Bacillota bacterium]
MIIISEVERLPAYQFLYFEIPEAFAGRTLGSYLKFGLNLSTGRIRALKKIQGIWVDGVPVWVNFRIRGGEKLKLMIAPVAQTIIPEPVSLSIIFEDEALVVVNKPAGMLVHPVKKYQHGTLANGLLKQWRNRGEAASFHPVHRLDRLTTGLVVVAKNPLIHQQLAVQLEKGRLRRFYLAVCQGAPEKKSGKIGLAIQKPETGCKWKAGEHGKPAYTRFRVLQTLPGASLVALKLFTGRTHQIRIHLANSGAPLWGDPVYGNPDSLIGRPALHAVRLRFQHPLTGQRLKFQAPIPEDFEGLLGRFN